MYITPGLWAMKTNQIMNWNEMTWNEQLRPPFNSNWVSRGVSVTCAWTLNQGPLNFIQYRSSRLINSSPSRDCLLNDVFLAAKINLCQFVRGIASCSLVWLIKLLLPILGDSLQEAITMIWRGIRRRPYAISCFWQQIPSFPWQHRVEMSLQWSCLRQTA